MPLKKFKPGDSVKVWRQSELFIVVERPIERGLYCFYRVRNVHGHEREEIESNLERSGE